MEAGFRDLIERAPDGVVISRDGIVLYANASALRLLGYDRSEELVGQPMTAFLDRDAVMTMRQRLQAMRESGKQPAPYEYEARQRDGARVTAEITSIFIEHEGAPAVLAFARDVTERVRMRAQLEHSDRLAALGLMAGGVAHEINNPLTFVTLAAEQLERRLAGTAMASDVATLVADIRIGVGRIAAIARDLRAYARHEETPPGPVDVAAVIDAVERIVSHEIRPRARVRKELAQIPPVFGVAMRIEQVFVNLLVNAAGSLEGRTDGEIVVRATSYDGHVKVEVSDNGAGIAADVLPRIFEPFFTTRSSAAGTGLGLSICRDIVHRFGGTIAATSEVGRGTTISVTFPIAVGSASPIAELARSPSPASPARRRILVIDDEPLIVAVLKRTLAEAHDVVGESDPREALTRLLTDPPFDVVLCDLMMPGLTGMDVYASVARERPGLEQRFVFISGGSFTQPAREFLEKIPNARLTKPFAMRDLVAAVESLDGHSPA